MVEMRHVTVTAERSGTWWVLECAESGSVSQSKRLSQVDAEMREAIAYQLGIPIDQFEIDLEIIPPQEYRELAAVADRLRDQAETASREAALVYRRAARTLAEQKLSVREIGTVMGISHQRAHQLLEAA
jgi:transcriptional regulator with XRE-family HTH domain